MQPRSTIDLHCHSTASDGELAPDQLVALAAECGVRTLALTDHDSVDGIAAAQAAAAVHGLELIPGIELSVTWENRTLHVVGLGIDPGHAQLTAALDGLQAQRRQRAVAIARKFEAMGVADALAGAERLANGGQITRTHFARLLINAGICKDARRAFHRYLSAGKPAYVATQWASLGDAIGWIRAAGGQAVLAHPRRYELGRGKRNRLLSEFRTLGGAAIEVCCGTSNDADIAASRHEALEHDLAGSVGSDFHGSHQPWIRLGGVAALPAGIRPVIERLTTRH